MAIITGDALDNILNGGAEDDTIDGQAGNDQLSGGAGQDTLLGGAGNDYLDGGTGADMMTGGTGDDTYVVDNAGDVVVEAAGEGTDRVFSSVDYTLTANTELLTLVAGTAAVIGTGNALDNDLIGNQNNNSLTGLAGNDYLDGGTGADTMIGGTGNDIYVVDNVLDTVVEAAGEGVDTVISALNYTLGATVENLTLAPGVAVTGTGNALDNFITGNDASNILTGLDGNDKIDGWGGDDTILGGAGDDILDGLVGNDNIQGGDGHDVLEGGDGNDLEDGGAGDDVLNGEAGADTLIGGAGYDTYVYFDVGFGIDTIQDTSAVAGEGNRIYFNTPNIGGASLKFTEDLVARTLTIQVGSSGTDKIILTNFDKTGANGSLVVQHLQFFDGSIVNLLDILNAPPPGTPTEGNDILIGTPLPDVINGLGGNDLIDGGAGADTMLGGLGDDTFVVDNVGDIVTENLNEGTDLVQSSVTFTLGANVENLTLTGTGIINGTGNTLNNVLTGNSAANVLTGGGGVDTMLGGAGDDTYVVDNVGDIVTENANEGIDTVQSSVTWTLGANVENLTLTGTGIINGTGNSLNNVLTGNSAANVLTGGAGNDTYTVSTGDTVVENANEGIDTVLSDITFTLGANVENLTLTGTGAINGTGNSLNNILTGNSAANLLTGGGGVDTMLGGAGDDTYVVDNAGDVVTEQANEGIDTVQSSVDYTLGANLENLTLTGSAVNGTGNSLNNVLTDVSGVANVLTGGAGDDTYIVGTGDIAVEAANEGIDTVLSRVDYTLGANIENLTLTGTAVNGTGNSLNNILTGVTGVSNVLTGGAGDDTYVVGTGDIAVEAANEGTDLVQSTVSYTLGANLENLTLIGTGVINGTGNSLNNVLTGNIAANVLTGGAGDDTYVVSTGDTVVEAANAGTDTVQSDVSFTLGANVENLTLTGTGAINGTGNSLNNILTGNSAANVLTGGAGDDTYIVGTGDTVVENANEGTDTVQTDLTYTLGNNLENLTLTGTGAIDGTGNSLNNILTGNSAANVLTGGAGDDTYVVSTGDTVVENANEGTDTVQTDLTYTLGNNLENLTLTGTGAIDGTGNSLNNILTGNSAANLLIGGAGADTMLGGAGDDTYVVDNVGDVVTEQANEGTDLVQSSVTFTLGANVENLTLTGTGVIDGTGNSLNNVLTGNSAANVLTGGGGVDTLLGGAGDDTYVVDNAGDVVTEQANEGVDTVQSSVSYTLGANLENLTLTGTGAIDGTGNELNNVLTGNSAANVLTGGAGADTLLGGAGDDTYVVDNAGDVVTEQANEGIDTVQTDLTYTLGANLENLTLTGTGAIDGTGNSLNNVLTGNSAANVLTGGAGDDTYVVSTGDTVVENANEGTDTVQTDLTYTLSANLENLTLTGTGAIDGTGNSLNNVLTGNSAANVLTGGAGDDAYVVSTGDTVVEAANEGTDLVQSDVSWTLGANVENLTLTGTAAIDGTGNSLNNTLRGNSAANVLTGGAGDDIYNVGAGDTVVEAANEGTDTVLSSVSWTLGANVEKLTLIGTGAIDGTGNSLNNTLTGNSAANVLTGGAGDDIYNVGAGDTVVEAANEGTDLVLSSVSWTLGANLEKLTLIGTGAIDGTGNSLNNTLTGNSAANVLTGGAGNDVYNVGAGDTVVEAANEGTDLVLSSVSWTLGANLENLTLIGTGAINGTGNSLNNTLTGNSAANVLTGGAGNDIYNVGAGDTVVEAANEGTDLVLSSVSWTLGANLENLTLIGTGAINGTGNSLNNVLTGNSAANVLTGGAGNDIYNVGAGDTVVEAANEGTDLVQSSVSFTLGANLENLTLIGTGAINGTGNSLNNVLTGNSAANVLTGGAGNDTYVVGAGDTVVEAANEGTDLVQSSVSWTLGANLENLTLTGTGAINGTGNSLNNVLTGNSAANVLTGGAGNDTYVVGAGDTVVEAANEGTDLVQSSVSWTLGANLENLTLTGTGAINGTGNSLNNVLTGNSAANVLTGGAGNDTLAGGLGNDTYRVDRGEGQDRISENDGTVGNNDMLLYGATINPLDLVLSRQVNDLRLAIHGSTDTVTIQNWYSAPTTAQVETIQAGNGQTLLSTQVDQLIQAMASFSQQTGLTWDQALDQQPQQVQTVVAASWQ